MEEMNNVVETGVNEVAENAVETAATTKGFNPKAGIAILAVAVLGYGLYRLAKRKKTKAETNAEAVDGKDFDAPTDDVQTEVTEEE